MVSTSWDDSASRAEVHCSGQLGGFNRLTASVPGHFQEQLADLLCWVSPSEWRLLPVAVVGSVLASFLPDLPGPEVAGFPLQVPELALPNFRFVAIVLFPLPVGLVTVGSALRMCFLTLLS